MPNVAQQRLFQLQQQMQLNSGGGANESGLITGPINRRAREKREAGVASEVAQAQQAASFEANENQITGSGIERGLLAPGQLEAFQNMQPDQLERALNEVQAAQPQPMTPIQEQQLQQAKIKTNLDQLDLERSQGIGLSPERVIATSDMLFDDRRRDMAPYQDRLGSYDQLMSVIDDPTGPSSMATLFKFISSMDDSVVRDSEGKMLTSSQGPIGELANLYNQAIGQGFFDEPTRTAIKRTATLLAQSTHATAKQISQDHDTRAAGFAREYQTPALISLSQGAGFNSGRQFDAPAAQRGAGGTDDANFVIPEGFE